MGDRVQKRELGKMMGRLPVVGKFVVCGLLAQALSATSLHAEPAYVAVVRAYVEKMVKPVIADPMVLAAIKAQNIKHADVSETDIRVLDATYRSEIANSDLHMVAQLLDNPVSQYLKKKQDESQGTILELFVTDCHGLNVAESAMTSDYWQGDEDKFTKTYDADNMDVFIDKAERDETTQRYETQASFVISDETGKPVGIATVTIALDAL